MCFCSGLCRPLECHAASPRQVRLSACQTVNIVARCHQTSRARHMPIPYCDTTRERYVFSCLPQRSAVGSRIAGACLSRDEPAAERCGTRPVVGSGLPSDPTFQTKLTLGNSVDDRSGSGIRARSPKTGLHQIGRDRPHPPRILEELRNHRCHLLRRSWLTRSRAGGPPDQIAPVVQPQAL